MKFSDDDEEESETKTEKETKIEDEGICLDDEGWWAIIIQVNQNKQTS